MKPTRYVFSLFCVLIVRIASGQVEKEMNELAEQVTRPQRPSASVYLRTSKDIYETREDVWFRAFVLDAQTFTTFTQDRNLYLRLVHTAKDSLVWKEIYPLERGAAGGHVYLDPALPEGEYRLEAYSAHSVLSGQPVFHSLRKITVTRDINTFLSPKRGGKRGKGVLVRFFPEGGNLVAGLENRVAFKAVDSSGAPARVSVELLEDGKRLLMAQSRHEGMGLFTFRPDRARKYRVRVDGDTLSLPDIRQEGWVMQTETDDSLVVRLRHTPGIPRQRFYCRIQVRGSVQTAASGLTRDALRIPFPLRDMPQGIAEVTLFDEKKNPVAERLVYLHPDRRLTIRTQLKKTTFGNREKVSVTIRTTGPDGKPVPADLVMGVSDDLYAAENGHTILTYCYLSSQLRGRIVNPEYYFDSLNTNRKEALDLLLMTQGWRRYLWDGTSTPPAQPVVSDTLTVQVVPPKKKITKMPIVMAFDQPDTGQKQFLVPDVSGQVPVSPDMLSIGRRIYLKCVGSDELSLKADDPFVHLADFRKTAADVYPDILLPAETDERVPRTGVFGKTLQDVVIRAKTGPGSFRDKYLGQLDSLAKLDGNTDYVGECGILNCPAGDRGRKPVEGKEYSEYIGNRRSEINTHPYSFSGNEMRRVVYHYPVFTEEELLRKFHLTRIQGYYPEREFYEPDYDREPSSVSDFRNTLFWRPVLTTAGEVTVDFYTSDIESSFTGIVEGIGEPGLPGKTAFHFTVKK